ncbi:MAG: hypothetical protein ABI113_21420 [Mucilaginibacter sp.]
MKLKFLRTLFVLSAVVFLYASCKKQGVPSAGNTTKGAIDYKTLSSTIGTQFYKSITGQYGGADVNKGITSPYIAHAGGNNRVLNSIPALCGTVIDTTYNTKTGTNPIADTIKTHFENLHFTFTCDAGKVNGYQVRDSLVNVANHSFFVFDTYAITQYYAVKALDQTYKLVSMDGSLRAFVETRNIEAPSTMSTTSVYYLAGLKVNFASGAADITTGTTSFKTTTKLYGPQTNYQEQVATYYGTIVYLGKHKAKVTFTPGASYIVDLITGVVTPA